MVEESNIEPQLTLSISDEAASSKSEDMESYCSPALRNVIVLDGVFQFLELEDLKTCRFVCHQWNEVIKPALRKRFIMTLTPTGDKTLEAFKTVFPHEIPVESLKVKNGINPGGLWRVAQLEEVFDHWQDHIKHLEVDMRFGDRRFSGLELLPMTQCNLTKLLLNNGSNNTSIIVSLDYLKNIKIISLTRNIVLDIGVQGSKIAPEEIELLGIIFHSNQKMLGQVILNNFIDFSKAKKININHPKRERTESVFLEMTQSLKVDSLELDGVDILGVSQAKWNIHEVLKLVGIPWKQKTHMKFTSLNFKNEGMDISKLPATIESLQLEFSSPMNDGLHAFSSEPTILNNLKYLSLDEHRSQRFRSCLFLFKNFPSLRALYLKMPLPHGGQVQLPLLNIQALPQSVKRMEIDGLHRIMGDGVHNLEMLILKNWHLNQGVLTEIRRRLVSKRIVVDTSSWGVVSRFFIAEYMEMIGVFQSSNEIDFWLGPATLPDSTVHYYYKAHIGEQTGRQTPEVISEEEFQDVRQLFKME